MDDNHGDIVDVLRHAGCSVTSTAGLGGGFPDLCVGLMGRNVLFEIKDGQKVPSKQKLTQAEQAWAASWQGEHYLVSSVDEALAIVGEIRRGLR